MPTSRTFVVLALALVAVSCRRDEAPPAASPGSMAYPPAQGPTAPAPPPSPAPSAQLSPRAPGFPCASDADLVCPFAHCTAGACGGCSSDADCKPNGACAPTLFGYACLARGFAQAPPPQGTPWQPTPTPPTPPAPPALPPPTVPGDRFATARQLCVDRTNEYRARVGVRAVARRPDRESCVDGEAAADSHAGSAHATMGRCGEAAQNACPDYPGQSPESTLSDCLAQMFAEGPGQPYKDHGHYINMTEPSYTGVACGFFVTPSGKLWITQDLFR